MLVAPIRTLSTEVFAEIFSYAAGFPAGSLYPDVPNRRLALVCKSWRNILLHSSPLWKTIDISRILSRPDPPGTLQRQLQLAHSTKLDVIFSNSDYSSGDELLQILESIGIDQWRSLVLKNSFFIRDTSKQRVLNGALSGLRSLIIDNSKASGSLEVTWSSMLNLIGKTASNLQYFTLSTGYVPKALAQSNVLSKLVLVNIPYAPGFPLVYSPATGTSGSASHNVHQPWCLPLTTTLRNCDFDGLVSCTFIRVTNLTVCLMEEPANRHPPIEMPELTSLTLKGDDVFMSLLDLHAPKLVKLKLIDDEFPINQKTKAKVRSKELRKHGKAAVEAFEMNRSRIHIIPIDLVLNLVLNGKSILLILNSWPQIRQLEFWDPHLRLEKGFFRSFFEMRWMEKASGQRVLSKSGALSLSSKLELSPLPTGATLTCPDLVYLQVSIVRQPGKDNMDMKWWRENAEKMIKARAALGLPLREILLLSDSCQQWVRVEEVV